MKILRRNARFIAIEVLCRWEENRLPIDQLYEEYIGNITLEDPRDRQLSMSLVYGALRWLGYLDWVAGKFSKHPLSTMKTRTLQALRVGVFQLLFLDRVPVSAAINETVQALKDMGQPKWLTGFVNAVLRTVDRQRADLPDPRLAESSAALPESAMLSHPAWLIRRWEKRYGKDATRAICRRNNTPASLCLRTNTKLTTPDSLLEKLRFAGITAEPGMYCRQALKISDYHGSVADLPGFAEGYFQVQDEAAQLVSMLLAPLEPGKAYLDACAGLGGKTSHLAQMLPEGGTLLAVEPNPGRVKKLSENLARLRLDATVTIVEGTLDLILSETAGKFAGILVDAPCSGLGVIRRHPDIRWNRTPGELGRYQELQASLLDTAARLLAPGGILVYATCSTEPEENDQAVQKFLAGHQQFSLSACREALPENAAALVDAHGLFRTLPDQDELDGFFAARLIKLKNED